MALDKNHVHFCAFFSANDIRSAVRDWSHSLPMRLLTLQLKQRLIRDFMVLELGGGSGKSKDASSKA